MDEREKAQEHVEDLDVPEEESEDVKGGLLLPASQLPAVKPNFNKLDGGGISGYQSGGSAGFQTGGSAGYQTGGSG